MKGKTMTTITFDRSALRKTYLAVVDGFALGLDDVVSATKLSRDETQPLLRELQRSGLIVTTHVNGERALTYQSLFDIGSGDDRKDAVKSFQSVYGQRGPIERKARQGATGPRYTDEQIQKAIAMRIAGESWKAIGQALGIKATAYLSKLLTPQLDEQKGRGRQAAASRSERANAKAAAAKKATAKKGSAKASPKRTVRVSKPKASA